MPDNWITICAVSDINADFPYASKIAGQDIGIYQLGDEYHALEDICPHAYALLSQGFVEDGKVECPLHEAVFDIRTGACLREPGGRDIKKFPLRVVDQHIQVQLSLVSEEA
ncbi:non-heme iron oxygenase ferredoxin subunit [Neisseriaceae bacterium TC5R-5]|nr:non-heme iron oxygenase ferredoxin subunit [Neisseriaceae bacterium TC5R-5]